MDCKCAVYGCQNSTLNADPNIQYFYFPLDPPIVKQWLEVCWGDEHFDISTARICSIHFDDDSYTTFEVDSNGVVTKIIKCEAIPTLFLPPTTSIIDDSTQNIDLGLLDSESDCPDLNDLSSFVIDSSEYVLQYVEDIDKSQVNGESCYNEIPSSLNGMNFNPIELLNDKNVRIEHTYTLDKPKKSEDPKYLAVATLTQLINIKNENRDMRRLIAEKERVIEYLNNEFETEIVDCRHVDSQLKKTKFALAKLKKKSITFNDQKRILKKVFSESQMKVLMGTNILCNYWSDDDMAVGYTLQQISNKRYLVKTMKIPLPAWSIIKKWACIKSSYSEKQSNNLSEEEIISIEDSE